MAVRNRSCLVGRPADAGKVDAASAGKVPAPAPVPTAGQASGRSLARRRGGLFLVAVAFIVSACTSGDDTAPTAAGTPTAAPGAAAASASPAAEKLGLWPDDYVLTEGPATAGFVGVPADSVDTSQEEEDLFLSDLAECLGVPQEAVVSEVEAGVAGPTFNAAENPLSSIDSYTEIVSKAQATKDLALVEQPGLADCFGGFLEEELGESATEDGAEVTVELVSSEMLPPPDGAAAHLHYPIRTSAEGMTIDFAMDILLFVEGQVETTVIFTNTEQTPPQERLQLIADQISEKLARQQPRSVEGRPTEGTTGISAAGPLKVW